MAGKKAVVSFIVEKDGSLTDIKVVYNVNPEADSEAIRVMKLSPKWKIKATEGEVHRVAYSIAIRFD